ncbi:hypothetical protein [Spirosoma pollinicola]|uniref:Uncharacterized protein n=1 Tax=Spirosoma pollinicola TaxID=2057025 RepID=A0A2K8Z030_9BACT|nr:hypothetical protein [Spirosoma pollinicola]AUD03250.1 hypothetical protein CWM47_16255 [Spirosoma pollinicola]
MESIHLHKLAAHVLEQAAQRATRRKGNGQATAALLIQMATEILTASPTLRKRANITLVDLAAADKVRKDLVRSQMNLIK